MISMHKILIILKDFFVRLFLFQTIRQNMIFLLLCLISENNKKRKKYLEKWFFYIWFYYKKNMKKKLYMEELDPWKKV